MSTRMLGRSKIEVSALGVGTWAIGGPFWEDGKPIGWGSVDDDESVRAIQRALDAGVSFFDTADMYGCGHSERILGRALAGQRARVCISTKFGKRFDEATRQMLGKDASAAYIRQACEASLGRLGTDYIDLYHFHIDDYDPAQAGAVRETLEQLVGAGKIRAYAWSTNDPRRAAVFAQGRGCAAVQHNQNLFEDNARMLELCDQYDLASICRSPLAMGLLTGKFSADSRLPEDDVRRGWNLRSGDQARRLKQLAALREVLCSGGRTLAQGALGWIWARSPRCIPIPGFKTAAQIEENVGALRFGPLSAEQMAQIDTLLGGGSLLGRLRQVLRVGG